MDVVIERGFDKSPYVEMVIYGGDYIISFRRYPTNVFVGVQGIDNCESEVSPLFVIEKTKKEDFQPFKSFLRAMVFLGAYLPSWEDDYLWDFIAEEYSEIEKDVVEWTKT